ncbi:hypothetical protein OPV22_008981 [Ensete ventricosum]|uniref:Armadillo repeat-containing domain-containing protein n=1 Tax=Ensete ventricosum TaxID=4639 RepID=A0AAV8PR47_ENSVE|nr:hypothetical protein OPV22_008981 [Ensete ventricosum]
MVSLADSQCGRAPRYHHGRSMRTVRSYLFHHRPSTGAPPALAPSSSAAVSENLTDSVVDFKLRELAVGVGSSVAEPAASTEELLEISREFSDCSSFGSDISGELQRLASLPRSEAPRSTASPEIDGIEALGGTGTGSSSEILESASLDGVEPVVRACVEGLGSPSAEAKRVAASKIRLLAKHRSDFRAFIGASGAIPALVPLLRSTDPAAQESAATALLNLSLEEVNKGRIAAAGAIKPLVYAMRTGTAAAKQNAACALLSLSMIEENRATIGACGAIPPLVALLERAVSAGAAVPLVGLVGESGGGTAEKAMVVLGSLGAIPEGREAIVEAGGIPTLVEAIEAGPARGREFAVHALLLLCADSPRNRGLLVREGAIPPLVALSQCGSARAKLKAETLLGYLREQRQDMARF